MKVVLEKSPIEGLIMYTDVHLPTQSHQEGTSNPTRINFNETLRSMHQSIEGLARQFQSGYQGRPQARGGRRGGLGGRGYHRRQEEFPRYKAWYEDNLYEDYGDNPNVGQEYPGGYYGIQQGDKALDKIKWKVPSFKGEDSRMNLFKCGADDVNWISQSSLKAKSRPITRAQGRKLKTLEDNDKETQGCLFGGSFEEQVGRD
ncbi:hypothetical protein M9H77_12520 [Catharanthus roseus]|uniref:Uncharacterized protein n=1 Tax=Catharanthus roseus TaxID=4058 RepID=A0ACC0BHP0_CATRO|nr:hypothetical protein M9H77_12520 [Catharanthus roseus]